MHTPYTFNFALAVGERQHYGGGRCNSKSFVVGLNSLEIREIMSK